MNEIYKYLYKLIKNSGFGDVDVKRNDKYFTQLFEYFMLDHYNCKFEEGEHYDDFAILDEYRAFILIFGYDISIRYYMNGAAGPYELEHFTIQKMTIDGVLQDKQYEIDDHLNNIRRIERDMEFLNEVKRRKDEN